MREKIILNPKGKGDWVAYSLREGFAKVWHRGSSAECIDAVLHHPEPPLYVKWKPEAAVEEVNISGAERFGSVVGG